MLSSRAPTVSPKSLRACSRTTVVRKEGWSCDTTGLVASRGRHLIIRSAITLSPHCRRTDTAHTGCTGWNSSCSRQILRLIFCFCAVDNGPPPLVGSALSDWLITNSTLCRYASPNHLMIKVLIHCQCPVISLNQPQHQVEARKLLSVQRSILGIARATFAHAG